MAVPKDRNRFGSFMSLLHTGLGSVELDTLLGTTSRKPSVMPTWTSSGLWGGGVNGGCGKVVLDRWKMGGNLGVVDTVKM